MCVILFRNDIARGDQDLTGFKKLSGLVQHPAALSET